MSDKLSSLGAVVTNTDPAHLPGLEPLTGQHVTLKRLAESHFDDLYENIGSHDELWLFWPDGPFGKTEFHNYLKELLEFQPDIVVTYSVFLLSGPNKDKALGLAFGASEERLTNRVAELGLFYGPKLSKSRAGTEAAYLLSDLLFKLNHRRLQWKTNALNVQSRKAAERYGFLHEGTFRQHQINKGRNRDSAWYAIIDSEWPICKKAFEQWLEDENFDDQQMQRKKLEDIRNNLK
jgi:RimJ/RimL family protein N-acetyltransferase